MVPALPMAAFGFPKRPETSTGFPSKYDVGQYDGGGPAARRNIANVTVLKAQNTTVIQKGSVSLLKTPEFKANITI